MLNILLRPHFHHKIFKKKKIFSLHKCPISMRSLICLSAEMRSTWSECRTFHFYVKLLLWISFHNLFHIKVYFAQERFYRKGLEKIATSDSNFSQRFFSRSFETCRFFLQNNFSKIRDFRQNGWKSAQKLKTIFNSFVTFQQRVRPCAKTLKYNKFC